MLSGFILLLLKLQRWPLVGLAAHEVLALYGVEIPSSVKFGARLRLSHRAHGVVIHPRTAIGDDVTIYHNVTIGRADAHVDGTESGFAGFVIENGVLIGAGAIILGGAGVTTIGKNSIIGAGAVVMNSTGPCEVWAGNPARFIHIRSQPSRDRNGNDSFDDRFVIRGSSSAASPNNG